MRYIVTEPQKTRIGWTVELVDIDGRSVTYYDSKTEEESLKEYQDLFETVLRWNIEEDNEEHY